MKTRSLRPIAIAVAALFAVAPARGQNFTWSGAALPTNTWTTADNWVGGVAPSANASLFFTASPSTSTVTNSNDYAANTQFNGITQLLGSANFLLQGNAINLGGNVTNSSTNTLTVAVTSLAMLQNTTFTAFGNNSGNGTLNVNGTISGDGYSLTKDGWGTLALRGNNTYTGDTLIRAGTLSILSNTTAGTTGNISGFTRLIMGGNNTARVAATLSTTLHRNNSTLSFNGTFLETGRSAISGINGTTGSNYSIVSLGAISRQTGAVINFSTINASRARVTTTTDNVNGILGGWATFGNAWAQVTANGTTGNFIEAYTDYTALTGTVLAPTMTSVAANNVRIGATDLNWTVADTTVNYQSTTITNVNTTNMAVGDAVSGVVSTPTGPLRIPPGTVIVDVDTANNTIEISQAIARGTGGTNSGTTASNFTITVSKPVNLTTATLQDANTIFVQDHNNRILNIGDGNTLRLGASAGIFRQSTAGHLDTLNTFTIAGGNLTAGGATDTPGEIVFHANVNSTATDSGGSAQRSNTQIDVQSAIVDNGSGAVSVVKNESGTLQLSGANTFTGGLYILSGRVVSTFANNLGGNVYLSAFDPTGTSSAAVVLAAAGNYTSNFTVGGTGSSSTTGALQFSGDSVEVSGTITLDRDTLIGITGQSAHSVANAAVISGKITGTGSLTFTGQTQYARITSADNDWDGDLEMRVTGSSTANLFTVRFENDGALGNGTANVTMNHAGGNNNPTLTLDLFGANQTVNGLTSIGGNATNIRIQSTEAATAILTLGNGGADGDFAGRITNNLGITKVGAGTQVLTNGNLSYTGATTVEGGTLQLSGTANLSATSGVTITGGVFDYSSSVALNRAVTISGGTFRHTSVSNYVGALTFTAGKLAGTNWNGNLSGLLIDTGKTVAPGASPGTATTVNQTWGGGGSFELEINNATGAAGTNWDLLTVTNTLDISGLSSSNKFTIKLVSLDALNAPGLALNFDKTNIGGYDWQFATFATLNGTFSSNLFTVDTTGFQNDFSGGGFQVTQSGSALYLSYIPEPGTVGLLLSGMALMAIRRRRRG